MKLTTQEREIRKRIEDMIEPQGQGRAIKTPLKPLNSKLSNGQVHAKTKVNGEAKKGKKRKGPPT